MAAGAGLHLITYLTELGYSASFAAGMASLVLVFAAFGKLGMGLFADRVSARIALTCNFLLASVGMILIFGAARTVVLIPFILIFGLSLGAPLVLVPMLVAESLGLKRFGSIGGIAGIFNTIGAFVGPVGAGKIYDLTGSYVPAFEAFVVMCLLGAAVTYSCRSFEIRASPANHRARPRYGVIRALKIQASAQRQAVGSTIRRPEKYRR